MPLKTKKEESKPVPFSPETRGRRLKAPRYNARQKFPLESQAEELEQAVFYTGMEKLG